MLRYGSRARRGNGCVARSRRRGGDPPSRSQRGERVRLRVPSGLCTGGAPVGTARLHRTEPVRSGVGGQSPADRQPRRARWRPVRAGPPWREGVSTPRDAGSSPSSWRTTAAARMESSRSVAFSGRKPALHTRSSRSPGTRITRPCSVSWAVTSEPGTIASHCRSNAGEASVPRRLRRVPRRVDRSTARCGRVGWKSIRWIAGANRFPV